MTELSESETAPVEQAAPNSFELCTSAPEFVASLRDALHDCRATLFAQFMTFEGDASGNEFADLLIEKATEGVDVRLLLDSYTDVIANDILPFRLRHRRELRDERADTDALLARLERHGIRIRRTAPPGFLWRYMLFRNHKKIVAIDDRAAFVGGINVSDHNYRWNDFMAKISGPLAADIAADFRSTWEGVTVVLDQPSRDTDFVLNQSPGRPSITDEVMAMIENARTSVVIESPSLLGDAIELALLDAAHRGVRVTAIVPARHNRWIMRIWMRKTLARLAHENVTIHGYQGSDGMTHAKLVIVDDDIATFGSFNLFDLEGLTQKELNVFTRDRATIADLRELVARDLARSSVIVPPRTTFGRFTYSFVYWLFEHWTSRLVRRARWRAEYC